MYRNDCRLTCWNQNFDIPVKTVNFDICKKATTIQLLQKYFSFIICIHEPTNVEKLKFGPVFAEYLLYVDCCRLVPKGTETSYEIFAVGLIITKIAQNVEKMCPLSRWIKVTLQILPKIDCYGNVPKGINKEVRIEKNSRKYLSFGEKNRENRCTRFWDNLSRIKKNKKLTQAKYIALPASLPSQLKQKTGSTNNRHVRRSCSKPTGT